MTLTTQQEQVLALISAGATIADAAQSAGIHRNTIYHWLRSAPEFQNALEQAHQAKALFWQEQAEELAADALATIHALMTDPKTPAATRLKAAQLILNLATNPPKNTLKFVHKYAQLIPEPEPFQEVSEDGPNASEGGAGASACDGLPQPEPAKVHNTAQQQPLPPPHPQNRAQ